jgi:hypothetical protein
MEQGKQQGKPLQQLLEELSNTTLLTIYDKSAQEDIAENAIKQLLNDYELL